MCPTALRINLHPYYDLKDLLALAPGLLSDSFSPLIHSTYSTASSLSPHTSQNIPAPGPGYLLCLSIFHPIPRQSHGSVPNSMSNVQLKYCPSERIFLAILSKIALLVTKMGSFSFGLLRSQKGVGWGQVEGTRG